jgi:hypothetical protein
VAILATVAGDCRLERVGDIGPERALGVLRMAEGVEPAPLRCREPLVATVYLVAEARASDDRTCGLHITPPPRCVLV